MGKTQKAQQAFRLEWAKKEYNKLISQHKIKKDTFEEIDQSVGEYMTIGQIFELEGGNSTNATIRKDGIKTTCNYIKFCLERSHFCAWSDATQRCDFLRLTRRWFKSWKQEWTLKTVIGMAAQEKDGAINISKAELPMSTQPSQPPQPAQQEEEVPRRVSKKQKPLRAVVHHRMQGRRVRRRTLRRP